MTREAAGGPILYFVAHNRNMIRIFAGVYRRLEAEGMAVRFAIPHLASAGSKSRRVLNEMGLDWMTFEALEAEVRAGDTIIVGTKQSPPHFPIFMQTAKEKGVRSIAIVDGCRFARKKRYEGVDHVLVWGPSGQEIYGTRAHIVGAPMLEATRKVPRQAAASHAVINF
ncbi:MAG: hypothetical protein AAFY59_17545, partial [Pseudomonadota bacterium]